MMATESRIATKTRTPAKGRTAPGNRKTGKKLEAGEKGLLHLVDDPNAKHRALAGTASEAFNTATLNQALCSVWLGPSPDDEKYTMVVGSAAGAMLNIGPKDAIEGMLAAQMVATHNASMECFRRAMIPEQSMDGRDMNLAQANKLTRSYATLVNALDKHRGKGQQTVRVEHVHVYGGGQAIVGNVDASARQRVEKADDQPFDVSTLATPGEYVKR